MTFHQIPAQPGQNRKKSEITFFPRKNDRFYLTPIPAHRALPKCKHGQSAPNVHSENTATGTKNGTCAGPKPGQEGRVGGGIGGDLAPSLGYGEKLRRPRFLNNGF